MKILFHIILIGITVPALNVFAQLALVSPSFGGQYFFTNYTTDNGLSSNSVGCIAKDSEGYLWIGTEAGLNRFNGYDFTVFKSIAEDTTTIPSNSIRSVLSDKNGNLWIATSGGVCRYHRNTNSFERIYVRGRNGESALLVESFDLFEDARQNIWAGYSTFGLTKYSPKQNCFESVISPMPPLANNMVRSVIEDADGSLWMNSYRNLMHFNPLTNELKEFANELPEKHSDFQAVKVCKDFSDNNFLWIATWGSGLVRFNKLTGKFTSYKFHPHGTKNLHNIVFDVHEREKNKLWLATSEGIVVFDSEKNLFEGFVGDSINSNPIIHGETHCIYGDDEAVTWIAGVSGFCNIHPAKQNFVNQPLWLNAPVTDYYYDELLNKIYGVRIYSDRSLIIYDRKKNKADKYKIPQADELQAEPFSIAKDNNGLIWLATTKGIYTFDELHKKFSLFDTEKQLGIPSRS